MKCPACTSHNLLISERQGIEIDYCPQCRGVWLDRGELDKLIERAAGQVTAAPMPSPTAACDPRFGRAGYPAYGHEHKRRKKGFLGEIFDFD